MRTSLSVVMYQRSVRQKLQSASKKAMEHYANLAGRAADKGYAIDLICASLEETGLHEMRPCVQRSGGVALQAETFGAKHLRSSLSKFYDADESTHASSLGYRCALELRARP